VLPQGGLAGQPDLGSGVPAGTLAHAPANPVTAHDWQRGQDDVVQQTPSTQVFPVRQSSVEAHACPSRFLLPHRLVLGSQMSGAWQSASVVHAALHADVPLHLKGAHAIVVGAWQWPTPSHVRAWVSVDAPAGHEGARHCVSAAYIRQAPRPSQTPSVPQVACPWLLQVPCGSVDPFGTLLHIPSNPDSAHD